MSTEKIEKLNIYANDVEKNGYNIYIQPKNNYYTVRLFCLLGRCFYHILVFFLCKYVLYILYFVYTIYYYEKKVCYKETQ